MSLTYLGELSVGGVAPGAAAAVAAGEAGIGAALGNLSAQLAALEAFAPVSLDLAAQLTVAQSIVTNLMAAISLGLTAPSLSAQIALISAQITALIALIASVQAQLDILVALEVQLGVAGVFAYAYDGPTNGLGSALTTELSGGVPGGSGGDHADALVLVTTAGLAWSALGAIMKVTP